MYQAWRGALGVAAIESDTSDVLLGLYGCAGMAAIESNTSVVLLGLEGCAGMAAMESDTSVVCIRPGGVRWRGCYRE